MRKTTTNKNLFKHSGKTGYIYTLFAGALLILLGLPAQGIASQQMQIAALESAFNSHVVVFRTAEDSDDSVQDDYDVDDEPARSDSDAKSDLMSSNSDNYDDMNDDYDVDDEPAASERDAKSDAMFSFNASFRLMVALNDQGDDTEEVGYGDYDQDED